VRLGEERRVLRQGTDDVADVDEAEVLDLLRVDDRDGLRRIESAARDARPRDDDLLLGRAALRAGDLRQGGGDGCNTARSTDALTKDLEPRHVTPPKTRL